MRFYPCKSALRPLGLMLFTVAACGGAGAQVVFQDAFQSAPSPLWDNTLGNWAVGPEGYRAQTMFHLNYNGLPFTLTNFVVEVDIHRVADGGIWLRSDGQGKNGILLVTGGIGWGWGGRGGQAGQCLYWHVVRNGTYAAGENLVNGVFTPEVSDAHLRVEVTGNVYSAFLNGSPTPATSFTNNLYASGKVALDCYSIQSFSNFVLTATPATAPQPLPVTKVVSPPAEASSLVLRDRVLVPTVRTRSGSSTTNLAAAVSAPPPMVSISTAVEISWPSLPGAGYQVQWSDAPDAAAWNNLGAPIQADATNTSAFDSIRGSDRKFYRVQVLQ